MAERRLPAIAEGFPVFLSDGADAFGAVRSVGFEGRPVLVVNVENGGDFQVPLTAVDKVVGQKVIVAWDRLEPSLQEAIGHTMDQEDFPPPGEEVTLVPPPLGEDEDDQDSYAPSFAGPGRPGPERLDELPGRDHR